MLAKLELWIEYEQEEKLTYNISSLMHGILMEQIDPTYGEVLHRNGQKPFHQSVSEMRNNHFKWTICTLNVEARKQIIDVLVTKKHFYMKHKDLKLKVTKWNLSESSYDELIKKYYFQKNARNIPIRFVTPTAFKSNGKYVFYPDIRMIYQSLMMKYTASSEEMDMIDEDTLEQLTQNSEIVRYHLRSMSFPLEGVNIPGFVGSIRLKIKGTDTMARYARMLMKYGQYSGVGIKTAMGMGAIRLMEQGEKKNDR